MGNTYGLQKCRKYHFILKIYFSPIFVPDFDRESCPLFDPDFDPASCTYI